MKWPICVQDGWYVMKNVSRYKQMQSNPVISFWSQSFKAVDFSQLVYFGRSVYSNTKKLLYTNFISLKNHNATWVRIASFWKEAVLLYTHMTCFASVEGHRGYYSIINQSAIVVVAYTANSYSQWRHIRSTMASQITSLTIVYATVHSGADQRKHQSSASLAFVRGIHRWPVNSPHKGQWRGKCFHLVTSSWTTKFDTTVLNNVHNFNFNFFIVSIIYSPNAGTIMTRS